MNFLKSIKAARIRKSIYRFNEFLSVGSDEEMGYLLAHAHISRIYLISCENQYGPFPDSFLDGDDPMFENSTPQLAEYDYLITNLRNTSACSEDLLHSNLASGLLIWVFSIRSMMHIEAFAQGRTMWQNLCRGINRWPSQIQECFPYGLPTTTAREAWYMPKHLVPSEHEFPMTFNLSDFERKPA